MEEYFARNPKSCLLVVVVIAVIAFMMMRRQQNRISESFAAEEISAETDPGYCAGFSKTMTIGTGASICCAFMVLCSLSIMNPMGFGCTCDTS